MYLTKAKQFLSDATLLINDKRYDSAASRCYYAIYRLGIYILEKNGEKREGWSHYGIQKTVKHKTIVIDDIVLHDVLARAYQLRILADYQTFLSPDSYLQLFCVAPNAEQPYIRFCIGSIPKSIIYNCSGNASWSIGCPCKTFRG